MPENPRPPRPRPTSYSELKVRPEVLRDGREYGPPSSSPLTKAERDAEELRRALERANETIARQSRELDSYKDITVAPPPSRSKGDAITHLLRAFGLPSGTAAAIAIAVMSYTKPAAKPEQVEQVQRVVAEKENREVRKASAESTYDTLMRAAIECRFAQLSKLAQKQGYELDWEKRDGVIFVPDRIEPNARGKMTELGPWRPRPGTDCPPFPEKPSR